MSIQISEGTPKVGFQLDPKIMTPIWSHDHVRKVCPHQKQWPFWTLTRSPQSCDQLLVPQKPPALPMINFQGPGNCTTIQGLHNGWMFFLVAVVCRTNRAKRVCA